MNIKLYILLMLFFPSTIVAQEVVSDDDLYQDLKFLVYKRDTKEKFTGISQIKRKNGHIVSQRKYEDGVILETEVYFNNSDKEIAKKTIYYTTKPYTPKTQIKYYSNTDGLWREIQYNNELGRKIKMETFKNEVLTYRCEFLNGKKHGSEYCLLDDGTESIIKYHQGKKID